MQGKPSVGGVNTRGVAEYSDFGPIERYDLERRNSPNRRVISPNSVAFWVDYVKVVKDTQILSAAEM